MKDTPIRVIFTPELTREEWAAIQDRAMRAAGYVPVSESRTERVWPNAPAIREKEAAA